MANSTDDDNIELKVFVGTFVLGVFLLIIFFFITNDDDSKNNNHKSSIMIHHTSTTNSNKKQDKIKEFFSNLFQKKKPKGRQIIRRRDCKNTPINFKRKYSKFPDMYNINKIPSPGLGANSRMVALGKGSCHSNVNGVNKLTKFNEYGRIYSNGGNQSYAFCVPGSDNFFDEE